jgi:hypothetical protein
MKMHRRRGVAFGMLTAMLGWLAGSPPASVRAQSEDPVPISAGAVGFAVSAAARELPPAAPEPEKDNNSFRRFSEGEGRDAEEFRSTAAGVEPDRDGAVRDAATEAPDPVFGGGPLLSFDALSSQDNFSAFGFRVSPPDTNMDVGPNHVVETTNLLVRVFSKTGAPLTAPFKMSSLFTPLGGICSTDDDGDPIVLYDPLADRWLISQFAFTAITTPPYHQCVAISRTGDPTGTYFLYDFVVPNAEFNDYPKFGVWPDAYYMTVNQFLNGGGFDGTGAYAFDRARMLVGDPGAGFVYFNLNLASHPEGIGGMLPSDVDGLRPPAPGAPNTFAYFVATEFGDALDGLRLFDFHVDFAVPGSSTFVERPESPVAVAAFNPLSPAGRDDILQPPPAGAAAALDSISDRLMHRLQYRAFGGHESLVTNHTVNITGGTTPATYRAGIRYYELRRQGGGWTVHEQGTFSPDTDSRWMGSAATDNGGNLAVGYSVASTATFPSIRYAGRLASDPPGSLAQGEQTLVAGSGVQTSAGSRWGDYSMMAVDPADDCTFWYTTEYYTAASQATSTVGWLTRIGSFRFAAGQCTTPARGTLEGTVTSCITRQPIENALVQTANGFADGTDAAGSYSMSVAPDSYTVTASAFGYAPSVVSGVVVAAGGTTTQDFCLNPAPDLVFDSAAVSGGNGNGVIEFNECNDLAVNVKNIGFAAASALSATLSSSTPGVTVAQPNSPYPDVLPGGTAGNSVPFEVSTSSAFVCGTPIDFVLTLSFSGGTDAVSFTVPTCTQAVTVSGSLAAGDPQQTGRLNRFTPAGSCAAPEACPGVFTAAGARAYDTHTFMNAGPGPACVKVDVSTACTGVNFIFPVAYLGGFNPSDLCANYLADAGASPNPTGSMSFNLAAGSTVQLVVHEVTPGAGCAAYNLTVSGLGGDGGGECIPCTIACPADTVVPNDPGLCGAVVNYPPATLTGSCGVLTEQPPPGSFFPVGITPVSSSATAGPSCTRNVVVNDTEPPAVGAATASPNTLFPPNHAMVPVSVSYTSSDNCAATCSLGVASNEPIDGLGDGDTAPDWEVVDAHNVRLRAERSGRGNGRVYTITAACTDDAGNTTTRQATVRVPRNQGH